MVELTPFSTVGPFFKLLVRDRPEGTDCLVTQATRGERITISGTLSDGRGAPIDDGLVEIWQADAEGHYPQPGQPIQSAFVGFGRAATGSSGQFSFTTIKPGPVSTVHRDVGGDGCRDVLEAPHILVSVMARGVMSRCWTRMYFAGEPLNDTDPVLQLVPASRRDTLLARRQDDGAYEFNIVLQGDNETVFFEA